MCKNVQLENMLHLILYKFGGSFKSGMQMYREPWMWTTKMWNRRGLQVSLSFSETFHIHNHIQDVLENSLEGLLETLRPNKVFAIFFYFYEYVITYNEIMIINLDTGSRSTMAMSSIDTNASQKTNSSLQKDHSPVKTAKLLNTGTFNNVARIQTFAISTSLLRSQRIKNLLKSKTKVTSTTRKPFI